MVNYIKFIGDYSKLKSQGYTFQKLYAGNYMQWEKDGFRVWKRGAELTIDDLTNYEGSFLKMLIDNRWKESKLVSRNGFLRVVKNNETFEIESSEESLKFESDQRKAHFLWHVKAEDLMPCPEDTRNWLFSDSEKWFKDRSDILSDQIGPEPKLDVYLHLIPLTTVLSVVKMLDAKEIELGTWVDEDVNNV
jgi:hypothetical protein